jgi:hypothetical protein
MAAVAAARGLGLERTLGAEKPVRPCGPAPILAGVQEHGLSWAILSCLRRASEFSARSILPPPTCLRRSDATASALSRCHRPGHFGSRVTRIPAWRMPPRQSGASADRTDEVSRSPWRDDGSARTSRRRARRPSNAANTAKPLTQRRIVRSLQTDHRGSRRGLSACSQTPVKRPLLPMSTCVVSSALPEQAEQPLLVGSAVGSRELPLWLIATTPALSHKTVLIRDNL